jgi:voltage-gated sodium channel
VRRNPSRTRLGPIVESTAFNVVVTGVILANAVILGMETYDGLDRRHGGTLDVLNEVCLGIFCLELALRLASYRRPLDFFKDPWNVFDFVVVAAAFAPGLRQNSTLLRLARLMRVIRVVRVLPDLRILVLAVVRSIPPLVSMAVLTSVIIFVYGMIGWLVFGDEAPREWGDIGKAMLTLFVLLTLENFPVYLEQGMDIEPLSVVYFISFVLVAAFIVLNVLIGIVINSMDEARKLHLEEEAREDLADRGLARAEEAVERSVVELRQALEKLEAELRVSRAGR